MVRWPGYPGGGRALVLVLVRDPRVPREGRRVLLVPQQVGIVVLVPQQVGIAVLEMEQVLDLLEAACEVNVGLVSE